MANVRKDSPETAQNKRRLLKAMGKHRGLVSIACEAAGISRRTYYNYMKKDPKFRAKIEELDVVTLDFVENSLHEQIAQGNCASTIFYLKTRGTSRGYIEPQHRQNEETDAGLIEVMKTLASKLPE